AGATTHSPRCGRIEPAEVLQDEPPLLGGEPPELLPRGIAELRARAGGARLQDFGNVDAVAGRGAAHALLLLVGLLALQGPARVQQPAVQLLLAPDGQLIEASGLELARQLAGFLGERRSRGARPLRLEALELLGEGPLPGAVAVKPSPARPASPAASPGLTSASSSCACAAAICRFAKPSAPSSWGETSACFPAASRTWRPTASVPSSIDACCERVAAPASPLRSASATRSWRSASAAVSDSARSSAASASARHCWASESRWPRSWSGTSSSCCSAC